MSNKFDFFYQMYVDFCLIISLLLHQSVRPFPAERRVSARTTLRSGGLKVGNLETTWGWYGTSLGQLGTSLGLLGTSLGPLGTSLRLLETIFGLHRSKEEPVHEPP